MGDTELSEESMVEQARIKRCVSSQHAGESAESAERLLNEDLSDFYSAIQGKGLPPMCVILRSALNQKTPVGHLKLKTEDPNDKHSTHLFRTMHAHFLQHGSLPKSCELAARANGETAKFKDCRKDE